MAQLTLYLPDDVARRIKQEAKRERKSVSAYMAELAVRKLVSGKWPRGFSELYGSWEGEFPEIEDSPPDEVEHFT